MTNSTGSCPSGLTFVFGPMGSGKSACLVEAYDRARRLGFDPIALVAGVKPRSRVLSRSGLSVPSRPVQEFDFKQLESDNVLLIDEAQFLSPTQVAEIGQLSRVVGWVQCAGLLLNSRGVPFEGSLALLSVATTSVPCTPLPLCYVCGSPAIGDGLVAATSTRTPRRYANVCLAHLAEYSNRW